MAALEKHYTPSEIAKLWAVSEDTVRRIFRKHPGVLKLGTDEKKHKRAYVCLRIPESVLQAYHAERRKKAA